MSDKHTGDGAARIAGDTRPAQAARTVAVPMSCGAEITLRCKDCGEIAVYDVREGQLWPSLDRVEDAIYACYGFRDGRCECCYAAHVHGE